MSMKHIYVYVNIDVIIVRPRCAARMRGMDMGSKSGSE
jgi:hypothetical protein